MMKTICLLSRKVGTDRADFRDYYENNHAPLALGFFPFKKYIRNHLPLDVEVDIGFDTISEFWLEDVTPVLELMAGEVGKTMKADEIKFMDQSMIRSGAAEEHLLRGGRRGNDHGLRKTALLLKRGASCDAESFAEAVKAWGSVLPVERVSVDFVTPWAPWPADAVLWLWGEADIPAFPPGVSLWRKLLTVAAETSPDTRP